MTMSLETKQKAIMGASIAVLAYVLSLAYKLVFMGTGFAIAGIILVVVVAFIVFLAVLPNVTIPKSMKDLLALQKDIDTAIGQLSPSEISALMKAIPILEELINKYGYSLGSLLEGVLDAQVAKKDSEDKTKSS